MSDGPEYDVIILGGGAAGLMCAREAALRGRRVVVLERNERLGKKILISGGGRCNFTNLHATAEQFFSSQPDFCKSALARFTPTDFIALVEQHQIKYHEKTLGQLFCDFSSREIVELLEKDCRGGGVHFRVGCRIGRISLMEGGYRVETDQDVLQAGALVVATGGLSFPQIGASDMGYRIARQFGLKIVEPRPALVPLLWSEKDRRLYGPLSGISFEARLRCGKMSFRENVLLTHRGLSGPAVLQISSYWQKGQAIEIDLFPGREALPWLQAHAAGASELATVLSEVLPRRFVQAWCPQEAPSQPMKTFTPAQLEALARKLHAWKIEPAGDEGYSKAEVTRGGVDTTELSSRTMEVRRIQGLYFIGEVVDVTGWLGGYNFQWAWASGHAAGQVV